jgi:hypothetical protein
MNNALNKNRKRVLVFNPLKRLIAIFQSVNAAASAFGVAAVTVHNACVGQKISCHGLYFRHFYEDKLEIDLQEDLGTLRLEDYDKLMGLERKYFPTKAMSRIGMKNKNKRIRTKHED